MQVDDLLGSILQESSKEGTLESLFSSLEDIQKQECYEALTAGLNSRYSYVTLGGSLNKMRRPYLIRDTSITSADEEAHRSRDSPVTAEVKREESLIAMVILSESSPLEISKGFVKLINTSSSRGVHFMISRVYLMSEIF